MFGKSWFGLGGQPAEPSSPASTTSFSSSTPSSAAPASTADTAPTSNFATPLPSPSSAAATASIVSPLSAPLTIDSMLTDLNKVEKKQLTQSFDEVELLYIADNPYAPITQRETGTWGPLPMRNGSDKLLYGCGTAYLGGLVAGGGYGVIRGLQTAQLPAFKVRMNSVLNQTTRYGTGAANSLGVLSMVWAFGDNALGMIRGKSDYANHISSAFLTGVLFKSTAGVRPALFTGTLLATIVSLYGAYDTISTDGLQLPSFGKSPSPAA